MKNKVAIITGSSMGIGKALAREMAKRGAKVVLNGRNIDRLSATQKELAAEGFNVIAIPGDVSNVDDCKELINETIKHYKRLDILVNNAGISSDEIELEDLSPVILRKVIDVNILGSALPTKYALKHIKKRKGSVLFVGSLAGMHGIPGFSAYSISKMGVTALAESLRNEVKKDEVHIGLAYVSFTENDPQKTILDANGKVVKLKNRAIVKPESPETVAKRMVWMIEKRKFKVPFSLLGKLNYRMTRYFPSMVSWILGRKYNSRKDT